MVTSLLSEDFALCVLVKCAEFTFVILCMQVARLILMAHKDHKEMAKLSLII